MYACMEDAGVTDFQGVLQVESMHNGICDHKDKIKTLVSKYSHHEQYMTLRHPEGVGGA